MAPSALGARALLLEIPADIADLRRAQPALAERWRLAVGQAFQLVFQGSYRAVQFIRDDSSGAGEAFTCSSDYNDGAGKSSLPAVGAGLPTPPR